MSAPIELLGLPTPEALFEATGDAQLRTAYAGFAEGLRASSDGRVIYADYEYFDCLGSAHPAHPAVARLLAILLRPDRDRLREMLCQGFSFEDCEPTVQGLFRAAADPEFRAGGQSASTGAWPGIGKAMELGRELVEASGDDGVKFPGGGISAHQPLLSTRSLIDSMCAEPEYLKVYPYGDGDWGIVLEWNSSVDFFPAILGFVRTDDLAREFLWLLAGVSKGGDHWFDGVREITVDGLDPIATQMVELAINPDPEEFPSGRWLLELTAEEIDLVVRRFGDLNGACEWLEEVLEWYQRMDSDIDLDSVFAQFGHPDREEYFDHVLRALEQQESDLEEAEAEQERQWEERERALRPFDAVIAAWTLTILGPSPRPSSSPRPFSRVLMMRKSRLEEYLGDYVLEHNEMPTGRHDIDRGQTGGVPVGTVDFDDVARRVLARESADGAVSGSG